MAAALPFEARHVLGEGFVVADEAELEPVGEQLLVGRPVHRLVVDPQRPQSEVRRPEPIVHGANFVSTAWQ